MQSRVRFHHKLRLTKAALFVVVGLVTMVGAGCAPALKKISAPVTSEVATASTTWSVLTTSPDGRWTVLSTPNRFGDLRLRITGPDKTSLDLPGSGIPFGPTPFSPDSRWFLAQISRDETNPDARELIAYRLWLLQNQSISSRLGSLELPTSFSTGTWIGEQLNLTSPASSYNPARKTLVDVAHGVYVTASSTPYTNATQPTASGVVHLANTGYTIKLPKGWSLYEWTQDDPVFERYPYNGKPEPFLLHSTHGIQNREWAIEYPQDDNFNIACTLYYFVAPVDQAYLDDEATARADEKAGTEHISPPIIQDYDAYGGVDAGMYFERKQPYFKGDPKKYYDLFSTTENKEDCAAISASLTLAQ
jgi:hypothetical protein